MEKIKAFFSYIITLLNIMGDKEDALYEVLTFDEFHKAEGSKHNLREIFYRDEVITTTIGSGGGAGSRTNVLRVPYFVVAQNEKQVILDLKKKLLVGPKNYKEYDDVCDKNVQLQNEIKGLEATIRSLQESQKELESERDYIKNCIGNNAYTNYVARRGTNNEESKPASGTTIINN